MEHAVIPPAWVDAHAPVASLLGPLHPHWPWWLAALLLLLFALVLGKKRSAANHSPPQRQRTSQAIDPSGDPATACPNRGRLHPSGPTSPPGTPPKLAGGSAGTAAPAASHLAADHGCDRFPASRRETLGVAIAAVAAMAMAIACDGLVDDAYIQFRYAGNLAAGAGPVFNPGERLEGASGGAWIGAMAAASRLTGLSPGVAARILSLLLAPAAVLAASIAAARLAPGAAVHVAVAWAALATPALYAATGLETAGWALALWLLTAGIAGARAGIAAAGAALGAAVRPEALVLAALALPTWRRLPRVGRTTLAAAAVVLVAMTGVRYLYYGSPIPHAALVKGVTAAAGPAAGARYLAEALLEWWPLLLVLPAVWKRRRLLLPAIVPVVGWTALVVARGGDWMPGSRYLVPLLVLLAAALALAPMRMRLAVAGLLVTVSAWRLAPLEHPGVGRPGDLWRAMATHRLQCRWWEALGERLGRQLPAGTCLAVGPAGAVPYASRLPTFDLYGLNTRVHRSGGITPGHTLWGLSDAVAQGCAVIVPGRPVPQTEDLAALHAAASSLAAEVPELSEKYRPILLVHPSQRRLDIVRDIVWVRRQAPGDGPS